MQVCIITLVANCVVVLGLKLGEGWQPTKDLKTRLDYAADMFRQGNIQKIVVTGRWTIWFDWLGIRPPVTESRAMKAYLVNKSVSADAIIVEPFSKDTIGNLFGLRRLFVHDPKMHFRVVCAANHEKRVRYLCDKIIPGHDITCAPLSSPDFDASVTQKEEEIFAEQKIVLEDIVARKLENPNYRIYSHPYYKNQQREVRRLVDQHPEILRHLVDAPNVVHDLMKHSGSSK